MEAVRPIHLLLQRTVIPRPPLMLVPLQQQVLIQPFLAALLRRPHCRKREIPILRILERWYLMTRCMIIARRTSGTQPMLQVRVAAGLPATRITSFRVLRSGAFLYVVLKPTLHRLVILPSRYK